MTQPVSLEIDSSNRVATIRLDRPKVNAVNAEMLTLTTDICGRLSTNDHVGAVVLWGGPRVFAAGADITEFPNLDHESALDFSRRFNKAALAIESLPQVTITAVNGFALGGGFELALATDFRLVADDARFGFPEILLGLLPGGGGTQRLSRLSGITLAKELIYSGRQIGPEEAVSRGVASSIHEAETLYDDAIEMAAGYARGPASTRLAKRAILDGLHLPLPEAVEVEAQRFADAFDTDDCRSGVASFLENGPGKAQFTGH